LIRWSKAVGRTCTNLGYTLDGWFTPLKFAPGEGWYYGSAVDWAGQVLEKITGKSLGEYMAENIFKPLSMEDTTFYRESLPHTEGRQVECSYRDAETGELSAVPHPVPANPPINSGGAGLYTTALDHAKVLQALLKASVSGGIVRKETVDEMFRPQLSEVQHGMLKYLTDMFHDGMVPDFPPGTSIQHGINGIINLEDVPGKRRKGSMMWLGMANSHWVSSKFRARVSFPLGRLTGTQFIDRETGIAATLVVNVMPLPDQVVIKLWDELERAIYNDLLPAVR
jgi:CubicO group peptidase (beta-lactamase class C family)